MTPTAPEPAEAGNLTPSRIAAVLWESAIEAAVNTFLMLLFGGIAMSIVGGLFHDMTPSLPPGLATPAAAEAEPAPVRNAAWSTIVEHRYPIVFVLLFVLTCRARLSAVVPSLGGRRFTAWTERATTRLSEEWVQLIVRNGFGALISAWALVWVQNFSWTQWLWQWLLDGLQFMLQGLASLVLGTGKASTVQSWFAWYQENQFKFTFWLLYLAAISDDLGIPNVKTIGHALWRRFRHRQLQASRAQMAGVKLATDVECGNRISECYPSADSAQNPAATTIRPPH